MPKPPEYTMQLGPIKNQNYVSKDIQKSCAFIWLVPIFEKKMFTNLPHYCGCSNAAAVLIVFITLQAHDSILLQQHGFIHLFRVSYPRNVV